MFGKRRLRVLHLPTTVGGNAQGLARAERAIGLDSASWADVQNRFAYQADRFVATGGGLAAYARRWSSAAASMQADVLHYNFGSSLLPERLSSHASRHPRIRRFLNAMHASWTEHLDVRAAHMLGIPIFVTYQGDDARQGDVCRRSYGIHFVHEVAAHYYTAETDRWKRERIARFDRLAEGIFALNPDLLRVLPARAEFMPYASVDPASIDVPCRDSLPEEPLVVHAPSARTVKGTQHLLAAAERLRAEGVRFRLLLVEGMPNAEALRAYAAADLAVDQLLAGWYGGFAVECMALGVPVVAYLRREDFAPLPAGMVEELPVIDAHPGTILDVLRALLGPRRHELRELGQRGRRYVERWHNPRRIASAMAARYVAALQRRHGGRH